MKKLDTVISLDIAQMIIKKLRGPEKTLPLARNPRSRSELDIYFTDNFHAKVDEWGLTEDHARYVFYEGGTVKENMKVATYKREEIGIYVFRDR